MYPSHMAVGLGCPRLRVCTFRKLDHDVSILEDKWSMRLGGTDMKGSPGSVSYQHIWTRNLGALTFGLGAVGSFSKFQRIVCLDPDS